MSDFKRGEPVAVMSLRSNSPLDVLSIATVNQIDQNNAELADGRRFRKTGDRYIDDEHLSYIVPATRWHISIVHQRCLKPIASSKQA